MKKATQFTVHNSQLTIHKKLSALVPQCLRAFTLAETLIVIGIIGVVAALTLPNLNHATGDKERITKVKKIHSTLNEAYERAQVVYGNASEWENSSCLESVENENGDITNYGCSYRFAERIAEFLKASKTKIDKYSLDDQSITLTDGIELYIDNATPCRWDYNPQLKYLGSIYVDIDGFDKGKNESGYDQFIFDMTNQGLYFEGILDDAIGYLFNGHYGASRWILENDNADYLKADSTGKCNDSDIVLNWTTNTSCH